MGKRKQSKPKKLVDAGFKLSFEQGACYSCVQTRGRREYMEDFVALSHRNHRTSMYAVFDGHGGENAAKTCSTDLLKLIREHSAFCGSPTKSIRDGFVRMNQIYREISRKHRYSDGTTATVVCIRGNKMYYGNVGDSRCILVKRDGSVEVLTRDHNCDLKDECKRIKTEKGAVLFDKEGGIYRVNGVLAVTRAIGDFYCQGVSAVPETAELELGPEDAFIALASDGVWDAVSNEEVGKVLLKSGVESGVKELVELALKNDSDDNITMIGIDLTKGQDQENCRTAAD